jgi:hypothetical protein
MRTVARATYAEPETQLNHALMLSENLLSTAPFNLTATLTVNNLAGPPTANISPSRLRACQPAEMALIEFARFTFRSNRSEPHCIAYQA